MSGARPRLFRLGALIAIFSGAAALAHELLWTRRLVDLLGASSEATARVLGCFFLGLALGAACATVVVRRVRRPWRTMGLFEAGIGVLTLPALFLPVWTDWIWPSLGPERLVGLEGSLIKLAVSLVVVLPPAFFMGLTLPVLAAAVLGREGELGREGVWLYAFNTLGGVVGLLSTAFWALPATGTAGAMAIALGLNLAVAALCLFVDRRYGVQVTAGLEDSEGERARTADRGWLVPAMVLAFVSGVGVLGLEVLGIHLLRSVVYSSLPAATALLTTVILVLALAAALVPRITARFGPASAILPKVLGLTAVVTFNAPFWFLFWTDQLDLLPRAETSVSYQTRVVTTALVTLGPALLVAGLVLPLTFAWCGERGGPSANRRWGWLLAANGLGGLIGAEAASEILMPSLGTHMGIGVVAVLYGAAGLVLWFKLYPGQSAGRRGLAVASGTAALSLLVLYSLSLQPLLNRRIATNVLALATGREGVLAVTDEPGSGLGIAANNQYLLGASRGLHDERRQMLLALLLHPDPQRVGHVGHATGITPGAALDHPRVRSLTSIELSPLVARLSLEYFADYNGDFAKDPRAALIVEDGRTYVAAARGAFDVLVGDLYRPYGAGEGRLYSIEHFRAARRALRDGGLFCQWLPMFQLSEPQFEVILATFLEVFPEAHLVRGNLKSDMPLLGMAGFRGAPVDWTGLPSRCADLRREGRVLDGSMRHPEGIEMLYLGEVQRGFSSSVRVNTLDNAWIENHAGGLFVTHAFERSNLSGGRWLDFEEGLFRRLAEQTDGRPSEWAELGRRMTVAYHLRTGPYPTIAEREAALERAESLTRQITEGLPAALKNDAGALPEAFPDTLPDP